MITRRTLFILGAGSSVSYGFPTGRSLTQQVIQAFWDSGCSQLWVDEGGIEMAGIDEFRSALMDSRLDSIDAFLESNQQFVGIGKIGIAFQILRRGQYRQQFTDPTDPKDHWYRVLFNIMQAGAPDYGHFCQSTVQFVTYNYDRSLESFLSQATSATYPELRARRDTGAGETGPFPVVHLHGHVGNSRWAMGKRENSEFPTPAILRKAVSSMRMIHDEAMETEYSRARKLMATAEQIVVLGFGFHPINVERLHFAALRDLAGSPPVFVSTFGMGEARARDVEHLLGLPNLKLGNPGEKSSRVLEQYIRFN